MGLIQEVQGLKMEYKNAQKDLENTLKKIEGIQTKIEQKRLKEQEKKVYERDITKAVENDLRMTFERCFERDGLELGHINLSLKTTRDEIIKNVAESSTEAEYIDKIYETTLNKVKKIYENDIKAKMKLEQLKMTNETRKWNIIRIIFSSIYNVLKWIFIGIFMLICIILGDANKQK